MVPIPNVTQSDIGPQKFTISISSPEEEDKLFACY